MVNKTAAGGVLPPGTIQPKSTLTPGQHDITISEVHPENGYRDGDPVPSVHVMVRCTYPDGWFKDHQVKPDAIDDLFVKIVGQLRGRYGATEVTLITAPKKIAAGEVLKVEI